MEQPTGLRDELIAMAREDGNFNAELSLRDELIGMVREDMDKGSLKKIGQAALVGGANTAASAIEGGAIGVEGLNEMLGSDYRGLGQKHRKPGSGPTFATEIDGVPLEVHESSAKPQTPKERPLLEASFGVADRVRAWGESIGYRPSTGIVASTLESAAQSVPQLAGGLTASALGTAVGGPGVGLSAGAAFFAASDGGAHTSELYKKLINDGVHPDQALVTATESGVAYSAISGALEYVGLEKILKTRSMKKAIGEVSSRPQFVNAFRATAGAAVTEGATEVLQGAVGETLAAYARDDWGEFKDRFTKSDAQLQEFMVGALLGGAVRGGIETLNPENYSSFADWAAAKRGVVESQKSTGQKLNELLESKLARNAEPVAGATESTTEPGTADAAGSENGVVYEPTKIGDGVEDAASDDDSNSNIDGVGTGAVGVGGDQGSSENQNANPEQDFDNGPVGVFGGSENQGVNDRESNPNTEGGADVSPDSVFARLHGTTPIPERAAERFAKVNETKTIQQIQPETRAQRRAVSFFAERGVPLHLVKRADDSDASLRVPAIWTSEGVVMDANAGSGDYLRSLVYHEAFHDLKRRNPEVWENAYNKVRELDPDGLKNAESRYFRDAGDQGIDVANADRSDESLSRYAEGFSAWLESAATDPGKVRDLAEQSPDLIARILDALQRAIRRVTGSNTRTILERRGDSQNAAQLALELNEALDTLIGQDGGLEALSGLEVDAELESAASVAAPTEVFSPRSITVADTRPKSKAEFSNRDMRRRIRSVGEEVGFDRSDALDLNPDEQSETGNDAFTTSFAGPVPQEIKEALEGKPFPVRVQFKGNDPSGRGEDMLSTLGADEMIRRAETFAKRDDRAIMDHLGDSAEVTPEIGMIRTVMDLRGATPVRDYAPYEVLENPGLLPVGATFEIEGSEFVVYEDESGSKRAVGDAGHDFNLDGLDAVPVTKRSVRKKAGAELPENGDPLDDIPFAVAPAEKSRKFRRWFGESEARTSDNKPLISYHGTGNAGMTEVDRRFFGQGNDQYGPGFYTSTASRTASGYASRRIDPDTPKLGGEDQQGVLPVYMSLQNPIMIDGDKNSSIDDVLLLTPRQSYQVMSKAPGIKDPDGPLADWIDNDGEPFDDFHVREVAKNYESSMAIFGDIYRREDAGTFLDAMAEATGHDGVIISFGANETAGKEAEQHLVAWRPEQVKSATGNSGQFDPANPDIRYAVRDTKSQSLIDNLPEPPKPSRSLKKFFLRNNSDGMFEGIDPTPQTSFEQTIFSIRRTVQDKFLPVLMAQRAVEDAGGRITNATNVYRSETLYYGRAQERARKFQKDMVEPILRDLHDNKIKLSELDEYLYALHAPERNRAILETNPDFDGEAGSGMSDEDAAKIVDRVESGENAEAFKKLAGRIAEIREWSLDYMVENDLLSKAQADSWRSTYEHYVPLRSADPGTGPVGGPGGRGFEVRGAESKRAKGRKSRADSPTLFMIHQADRAIVRAERNRVGLSLMRLILNNPEPDLWSVIKPTRAVAGKPDLWGNSEVDIVPNPLATDARRSPNTIVIKEKGEERFLEINNEDLVRAYKNLGTAKIPPVVKFFSRLMRFRSALVTSYSPEFLMTNFVRDIQTAAFNITSERDAGLAKRVVKNVRSAIAGSFEATRAERREDDSVESKWAKTFREFVEDGGKTGWAGAYSFEDRADEVAKSLKKYQTSDSAAKSMFKGVVGLIEDTNTAIENGVRLSLYSELRDSGVSRSEAAEAAKNLTVNFNRRGELGTVLNTMYLFFNAGVQGSTRMLQAVNTPVGRKLAMGVVGSGLTMGILNSFLSDEDEDGQLFYDKISPWERSNNFILMLPGTDGRYVKFPLPYGYSSLYSIGTHASSAVRGEESVGESLGHMGASALNSFNPLGGGFSLRDFAPELVKPIVEVKLNENFAGSPINPRKYDGDTRPNSERYFSSASTPSRSVARFLNTISGGDEVRPGTINVSPGTIDHFTDFLGGSALRFVKEAVFDIPARLFTDEEMTVRSTPFIRRFMGTPSEFRYKRDFYENRSKMGALMQFERRYLLSDEPARVESFREEQGAVLEAAHTFDLYRKVIDSLNDDLEEGKDGVTQEQINDLYAESNRMVRAAERGEAYETPLLNGIRGIGKMRRDARRRLKKLEAEAER